LVGPGRGEGGSPELWQILAPAAGRWLAAGERTRSGGGRQQEEEEDQREEEEAK